MTVISLPRVSLNKLGDFPTPSADPIKILFVGQKIPAGSVTDGALVNDVHLNTAAELAGLFGAGAMLTTMINAGVAVNPVTQMDAIALGDGTSPALCTIIASGTATAVGVLTINVASRTDFSVDVTVLSGDTADDVATAIDDAIDLLTSFPVTSAAVTDTVTLTTKSLGGWGNTLGIEVTGDVPGITMTTTAFAGGGANPSLTNVFDVIEDLRYQIIIWPGHYDLDVVTNLLEGRWNVNNQLLDGFAISFITDTLANVRSAVAARNQLTLSIGCDELISDGGNNYRGGAIFDIPTSLASRIGSIIGLRLTPGANVSQIVDSRSGLDDNFGGVALASLPYFNSLVPTAPVSDDGKGFSEQEIREINTDGGFVIGNNRPRTDVIMGEIYTTYKTDSAGNSDASFRFLNYVNTISGIGEFMFLNLKSDYKNFRLTDSDDLQAGRNVTNENAIRGKFIQYYNTLSETDFMLTRGGFVNEQFFRDNLVVTIDFATGVVNANMRTPIVTQLREITGNIQITFNVGA